MARDLALIERAWRLQERYALSWWDALIVAAAQSSECAVLLTEDLQHGQRLGRSRVINPFRSPERTPAEVLEATRERSDAAMRLGKERKRGRSGFTTEP